MKITGVSWFSVKGDMVAHQYTGMKPVSKFINAFSKVGFELHVACFIKENSITIVPAAHYMIKSAFILCP